MHLDSDTSMRVSTKRASGRRTTFGDLPLEVHKDILFYAISSSKGYRDTEIMNLSQVAEPKPTHDDPFFHLRRTAGEAYCHSLVSHRWRSAAALAIEEFIRVLRSSLRLAQCRLAHAETERTSSFVHAFRAPLTSLARRKNFDPTSWRSLAVGELHSASWASFMTLRTSWNPSKISGVRARARMFEARLCEIEWELTQFERLAGGLRTLP